ncbi:SCO family protein [Oleidesulfovibrio alaskensis]|jgi:protein SCO1/2|uniref:SCO family protein n=1 Tax=Oleidesulfovibrio alaskensis TaxID=58180 RepID=UPI001A58CCA4|nr:SCO family protein [Oleidesulfovibrio alaskensis]MBL3581631.1 SCO family protein [Oleidesulfovibrio alaskensis]MBL3588110.1 SCO family protein [bacterium]
MKMPALLSIAAVVVFCLLAITGIPAAAEEHTAHTMQNPEARPAAMPHAVTGHGHEDTGHEAHTAAEGMPQKEDAHVHPSASAAPQAAEVDEKLGQYVPEGLSFTDSQGRVVDIRSVMDKPTIVAPVYYSCPTVCNILMSSIASVLPGVTLTPGKDYKVLSVSFDELDTPELAARKKANYMQALDNAFPPEAWLFLTGDKHNIDAFMDSIGFRFQRQGRDFIHPVVLVAVSPEGKIVRYLYGSGFLPFDITMAATEAAEGKVGLSVKRVLAYCFTYDPEGKRYVFDFMRIAGIVVLSGIALFLFLLLRGGKKRN